MDARTLLASYDHNGVLGALSGADDSGQARWFDSALAQAREALARARQRAAETDRTVELDASRLSGVNGGERWRVAPSGRVERWLEPMPEAAAAVGRPAPGRAGPPPAGLDAARPLLARAAYNGLWSPSGTNWQPIRCLELGAEQMAAVSGRRAAGPGLLVLARERYESILGDVARLCGVEQSSHAEHIDLGIWLEVAESSIRAHGWQFERHWIEPGPGADRAAAALTPVLEERSPRLQAAAALAESVAAGRHRPAVCLLPRTGAGLARDPAAPGGLVPAAFDRLVEARSTQRVAAPGRSLERSALEALWRHAQRVAGDSELALAVFDRRGPVPAGIGRAMHAGLEGAGGLLARIDREHLGAHLRDCAGLPAELAAWAQRPQEPVPGQGLPAAAVPAHLCAKLESSGRYHRAGGLLLDHRDRPLTAERLIKLVRLLARSFGRFFLSFQDTHPLLGVLLVPAGLAPEDQRRAYRRAGRAVAAMGLLARARGLVSIIKSGPIEIARAPIAELVAAHADDPALRRAVAAGRLAPLLTFQLGHPLAPGEAVAAGRPDAHDGLLERKLDKRAPRARLSEHYVPALD